jgi:DNA-binding response OmpR family regulator
MSINSKGRILVVDDEETMRLSLGDILRLDGYQVQTAQDGAAAIGRLRRETFDLMLLDLKMPGMDGLEVLQMASKIAPDTYVILLTAHGSLESAIEALRRNAFDYLLKPSTPKQILESVAGAMAKRGEILHKRILLEQIDLSLKKLRGAEHQNSLISDDPGVVSFGNGMNICLDKREIWRDKGDSKKIVKLTPTEGKLIRVLLEYRGKVMTHKDLVIKVQGYDVTDWEAPEVLRPLVSRLRQKLSVFDGGENWISNVRGTGYILNLED